MAPFSDFFLLSNHIQHRQTTVIGCILFSLSCFAVRRNKRTFMMSPVVSSAFQTTGSSTTFKNILEWSEINGHILCFYNNSFSVYPFTLLLLLRFLSLCSRQFSRAWLAPLGTAWRLSGEEQGWSPCWALEGGRRLEDESPFLCKRPCQGSFGG